MNRTGTELDARRNQLQQRATGLSQDSSASASSRVVHRAVLAMLDSPLTDFKSRLRTVVAAEKLERLAEQVRVQGQLAGNDLLPFCQVAAHGGYTDALRAVRSLGVRPDEGGRAPAPVVLLEPMASPATYVRGTTTRFAGFGSGGSEVLPFPLVLVPPYPDESLGSLCLIQHEVGHNIDEDYRLTEALAVPLAVALESAGISAQSADTWVAWTREMVADVLGVLLGNIALPIELAGWANALGDADAMATRTHPYPSLRVGLAVQILEAFGVDLQQLGVAEHTKVVAAARTNAVRVFEPALKVVARVLLDTPVPALHGAALRDLAPNVHSEAKVLIQAAQGLKCVSTGKQLTPPKSARLLPSLARVAVSLGGEPNTIAAVLHKHALQLNGSVERAFSRARFDRTVLRLAEPPILDEEHDGLKRPPLRLFEPARVLAFVGASNDSLPSLFGAYRGSPKDAVDVFYLSEVAIRAVAHPDRSPTDLVEGRRRSLEALLTGTLAPVARRWAIYEYDDPFFFAAYFDAHVRGGRIHTSSQGWGQDLKRAPAVDFVWPTADPAPTRRYRWYLDALAGLKRSARLLAGSDE